MRNQKKWGEVINHTPDTFLRFFGTVIQQIETDEDIELVLKSLVRINDATWRTELLDPQDSTRRITLLQATLLAIIFMSRNNDVRVLFLSQLIDLTSYDLWDIKPPVSTSSELKAAIFNATPRECLLELCKGENGNIFYSLLRHLLTNMPNEIAAQYAVQYIEFCARALLKVKNNISIEMSSLLASLSEINEIDIAIWFKPVGESSESIIDLLSLLMNRLSQLIKLFDKGLLDAELAGTLGEFLHSADCVSHRRNMTYLIQIIYEIVKRGPSHHWNALNPLDHLLELVLAGSNHEIIVKIAEHVLRTLSQENLNSISIEKKEEIAKRSELAGIVSIFEGREILPIDLGNTLYAFNEMLSRKSALLLLVLLPAQYVSRLNLLSFDQIIMAELGVISNLPVNCWSQKLIGRDCPAELTGLTLFHAILLMLIKKNADPVSLNNALQRLVDRVPFSLWDQSDGDIKMSSRFQYNGAAARTPRHLLSNLCSRDTGHLFFPLLNKVLEHLPLLQFQSDIPDYLKMVMRSFVKQGPALEFSSALFFYFLVACSPNQENELFFRKMDFSVDEKQKKKKQSGVVIDNSIVGVLIDVFSAVMKTSRPANPQICELLMRSLIAIERRSSAEDWEPDVTMEGTTNFNGPLNRLACLVLDDAQNLFLVKVLEAVLAKASLESVHSISRETKEKLLAMPSFDQHQKLIAASREKKPVTKIVVTKAAPKPAAKKVVVSAPVLLSPAKKPVGKKMAHKPCAKLSVSQTNPDEPVVPISSQQLIAASISVHQQDLPKTLSTDSSSDDDGGYFPPENLNRPILRNSWADDSDFEEDDVGSKKSVRYRHEPYSLFFNRKVIVKSGHDVTVSDVLCVSNGNKKG